MMVFASNSNVQLAAVNTSHPHSQSSSPSSPTANFVAQQVLPSQSPYPTTASKISASNLRSGSRPSTPVQNTLVNGLAVATTSIISESPPPGMTYADFVRTWSDEHISRWLADHKCVAHATIFKENDIRGDVILDLDQQTLKEMGISSLGDRIRIINAVKALRQKCAARNTVISSITVSTPLYSPRATLNGIDYHSPIIPPNLEEEHYVNGRSEESSSSATRHRGRPAPLQLRQTQVNDLPRIAQSGPESARSTTGSANRNFNQSLTVGFTPSNLTATPNPSALSSTSSNSSGSSASRAGLPPLPPPPRSQPPLPPANSRSAPRLHAIATQHSGRRTPTQTDAPHYVTQPLPPAPHGPPPQPPTLLAPSSTSQSNVNWKGEYGLPSGPRSGNVSSGQQPNRSISPLPIQGQSRSSPQVSHAKNSSFSGLSSSPSNKAPIRPATSNSVTANPSHPYASPQVLQPPPNSSFNLSPIAESFVSHHTALSTGVPSPPTASTSASSSSGSAYTANRTQYNRPTTPSHAAAPSLEDLRRKLVRFFLADDGHSATISVADCLTGEAVLEKVLKKFGKLGSRKAESDTSLEGTDPDEMNVLYVDGWCVCLDGVGEDGSGKPLSEAELLSVCHAGPDHPAREHGLTVRRAGKPKRSKPLQQIFGEAPPFHNQSQSPDSPTSPFFVSPRPGSADEEDSSSPPMLNQSTSQSLSASQTLDAKSTKRASSISVLSALGVRDPERVLERSASPSAPSASISNTGKSPSASSFTSRIRSSLGGRFRGQRPPSELIATHLQDFFPYTEKKVLQKTARQSMLRTSGISGIGSLGRRDSAGSWNPQTSHSRFSTSTQGSRQRASMSPSRVSMSSLPPPPVPEKLTPSRSAETAASDEPPKVSLSTDDGHSIELHGDDQQMSISKPLHLLPPVDFPSESLSDAFIAEAGARTGSTPSISRTTSNASRRMSYITELRSKRDRSDTASMLTVDEITAEVENRRKSLTIESTDSFTVVEMEDGEDDQEESVRRSVALSIPKRYSQLAETEEEEEVDEEYDEDEDEDEDETLENEEIEDEDEDEHGKAMTSAGGKRVIKWIKGALIGAGSFGSVYLGLDAQSGLLMAVKQVELPTGSGANEERKKSMLNALEREIDLLKDLQHENIVQYLDSSSDDRYLNIFLEYVPGGSVTALLKSYGAFEEALVRNFVRQILTGLCYLHDREIIHRDIKGANILVDNKGGVKISDFGISKKVEGELLTGPRVHRPSLQGSVFWMAPEVVKQTSYTRKADIWSVGCLVVEMLTGQHPYPQLSQMQAIFKIGSSSKPTIPSDISVDAVDFLQKTFEIDHESRPDAVQLLQHPWILNDPANAVRSKLQKVI